ncbi:hypothetical protein [Teichococcus oryzae]|uniref:Uncharacterized protein n=1 Tax=Teichococcus oryzae TaxID=1608942 RepID=A0A5B2TL39_9PROT|nr:hypothetical protein [Pseudoroseomonas oryzae]KAA2214894.1 hypothetical protein F0Q34_04230 [Pseudoroseomonas oryzae]
MESVLEMGWTGRDPRAWPRGVVVRDMAEAAQALRVAADLRLPRPLPLVSLPGAGLFLGPGWFLAMMEGAVAAQGGVAILPVLDCADAPGRALDALRQGVPAVVMWPATPAFGAVAAAAEECGGVLLGAPPPALGPFAAGRRDAPAKLAAWLGGGPA